MELKPWYMSQTIISVAVMVLIGMFKSLDIELNQSEVTDIVTLLATLVAAIFAVIGRVKANQKLK